MRDQASGGGEWLQHGEGEVMDKEAVDWEAIEAEFRACERPLRDIAVDHGVTVADICQRARGGEPTEGRKASHE